MEVAIASATSRGSIGVDVMGFELCLAGLEEGWWGLPSVWRRRRNQ